MRWYLYFKQSSQFTLTFPSTIPATSSGFISWETTTPEQLGSPSLARSKRSNTTWSTYWQVIDTLIKKATRKLKIPQGYFAERRGGLFNFEAEPQVFFYLFHIEIQFDNLPPSSYQWYLDRQHVLIGPCFKTINTICLMIILEAATNSMNSERFAPTFGHLVFQQMYTHHLWLHYQTIPSISIDTKFTSPGQLVLWLHI